MTTKAACGQPLDKTKEAKETIDKIRKKEILKSLDKPKLNQDGFVETSNKIGL